MYGLHTNIPVRVVTGLSLAASDIAKRQKKGREGTPALTCSCNVTKMGGKQARKRTEKRENEKKMKLAIEMLFHYWPLCAG